ncbi:hypothetical protein JHK84_053069 [Glycine max]|nr:hypothetical protein JHK86_053040 [Glycine max]KAG5083031.1 hypothetical protein JHK84_053069 [Glycine max]
MAHYGKLDIMYNNAGIPSPSVPPGIVDLDLNELDFVMKINKRGMIADIKHAARVMILVGLGSILCTSSISGVLGKFYPGLTQEQIVGIVNGFGELEGAKCEDIDAAKAPLYLASDEAKFISGLNLIVDGGFTSFKSLTCHLQIKLFNPSIDRDRDKSEGSYTSGLAHGMVAMSKIQGGRDKWMGNRASVEQDFIIKFATFHWKKHPTDIQSHLP